MAIKINYLDGGEGIEILATGTVTGQEIIEEHKEIYNAENLKRQKYQIIDRTHCTKYLVSDEEVREIALIDKQASETNPNIIIAIVSSSDLQYGVSRAWQAHVQASKFLTRVFRDRISADAWIQEQLQKD